MIKKFIKILALSVLLLSPSNVFAADDVKGNASVYKITMTRIDLCETGSTASNCVNPTRISNAGIGTEVDIASVTAGASAAAVGNFGLAKSGTTYTFIRATMSRAITIKGVAGDCHTAGNGAKTTNAANDTGLGAVSTTAGDQAESILFVPAFVDATNFPQINSVGDAEGGSPRIAGTVNAADDFFVSREALTKPYTAISGQTPTVKIAFNTQSALNVKQSTGCNGANEASAAYPTSTITIQGQ